MTNIQVGPRLLEMDRDFDIQSNCVLIVFRQRSDAEQFAVLFRVPFSADDGGIPMRERQALSDDYYMRQAVAMMERLGGFAMIAQARIPGERIFDATLKAEYANGLFAMKEAVLANLANLPLPEKSKVCEVCESQLVRLLNCADS